MEYEAMDEEAAPSSSNMIPIALAALAIVLGIGGLYFGFNANKRLNAIESSIQESSTSSAEVEKSVAFFNSKIAKLESQLSEQADALNRLRAYSSQSEQAIKQLVGKLNETREQIAKTAGQVNEMRVATVQPNSSDGPDGILESKEKASARATGVSPKSSTERIYVIESGDTFAKIATRTGVSLQSIIAANPDADPRRLSIGQKIVIPVE